MDANSPNNRGQNDFDPWAAPASNPFGDNQNDHWADPEADRNRVRATLRRCLAGFSILTFTLGFATLTTLAFLILIFANRMPNLGAWLGIPRFDLIESTGVVWLCLIGVGLLWNRWPDEAYRRRAGLLLLMCVVDLVLWSLERATDLGLSDAKLGHEWFRHVLGNGLGWFEFALIADLAGRVSANLGESQAREYAKASRSVATIGGMVWIMFVVMHTNWVGSLWPLRERAFDANTAKVYIAVTVITAICFVQVSALCLFANRVCGRALREMRTEDRSHEMLSSRSESGWDDLDRSRSKDSH